MLHADIPTSDDIHRLATSRSPISVSIYVPTSLIASDNDVARLELKNLLGEAVTQLQAAGTDVRDVREVEAAVLDLMDDTLFWTYTSHSLAVFVTPSSIQSFRLPNRLTSAVEVSDRFFIKPLMRATTFSHSAFVLALAQNSVRLVEISGDTPATTVDVPDLPVGASDHLRHYARAIDAALRPVLAGQNVPLILAGAEPLVSIYRSVNTSSNLVEGVIAGSAEERTDSELDELVRPILDDLHTQQVHDARDVFDARVSEGRTALDLGDVARAATRGAVDTVLVDIDASIPGSIDEDTGVVHVDAVDDTINYGIVDEIVRRVLVSRGRVIAVRADEVPGDSGVAAILRYPS